MRITSIRDVRTNKKLSERDLHNLASFLEERLAGKGFITESAVINSSRIDLTLGGRSFKVDTTRLGYNAQYNPNLNYKAGYRKTDVPTWDQRVSYNNTVNSVLNMFGISSKVTSGNYLIRHGEKSFTNSDWLRMKPEYELMNEARGHVVTEMPA